MTSVTLRTPMEVAALGEFRLEDGRILEHLELAFELVGPPAAPVVLVLGGISAGAHVAASPAAPASGFWDGIVGSGAALDRDRFRVLGFDFLGGAGSSSGPRHEDGTLRQITTADQARAARALLDRLGIARLHACVGASYGGMVGLCLGVLAPERLERLVVLSAPHASHPLAIAGRLLQRWTLEAAGPARERVAWARALAMTTYRTAEDLEARFGSGRDALARVEPWLRACGERFARGFPPDAYLVLSHSLDQHQVEPEAIDVPVTLVASTSDRLVPLSQVEELARRLPRLRRFVRLESRFGHDAFLKEHAALAPVLREALEDAP